MKAQDFLVWMDSTGLDTAIEVSKALNASRNLSQRWVSDAKAGKDLDIKRVTALAMTAISQGLRPWDEYER